MILSLPSDEYGDFLPVPLGDGWSVMSRDGTRRIKPKQVLDAGTARFLALSLAALPKRAHEFRWVRL